MLIFVEAAPVRGHWLNFILGRIAGVRAARGQLSFLLDPCTSLRKVSYERLRTLAPASGVNP